MREDVKKSKQNSAKIMHRNIARKLTISIFLCNNSDQHVFPCINIRWVPRVMLKTSLGTKRMLMHGKTCLVPILTGSKRKAFLQWCRAGSRPFPVWIC